MSEILLVEGESYEVVESFGYHQFGAPAKMVKTDSGEKVAVRQAGKWKFWTTEDRLGINKNE